MTNDLFERLLYEEESTTLDFKKGQYRFAKANEDEKSEIVKDILGFANAWRRSEAYILIGVEDVRGGRGNVVGIPDGEHLDDHSLQQFINSLTNQPVRFHYEAFGFEQKQVGVIRIEEQSRPIYLRKDYGKLVRKEVYVRRGSSTDPTKPASPEEIAQMGPGVRRAAAQLQVEFAHIDRDDSLGTSISLEAEFCEMPPDDAIPDLVAPRPRLPAGLDVPTIFLDDPMNPLNKHFYRESAKFEFARRLFRPVRVAVTNVGGVPAANVRAEIVVPKHMGVAVAEEGELPRQPRRRRGYLSNPIVDGLRSAYRPTVGEVSIESNDERFRIEFECGDLQPGRRVWSDIFLVAKAESGALSLRGTLFADDLPQPSEFVLTIFATIARIEIPIVELVKMSNVKTGDE